MDLVERDVALAALDSGVRAALGGDGRLALISGEAGIGKTAVVEALTRQQRGRLRVICGGCDALVTPRPLGPLHDMAADGADDLATLLAPTADRSAIFTGALRILQARPTLAVIEDIHWADDATLDLLRFLGRRIGRAPALLVVTFRDDELGPRHQLRSVLGDIGAASTTIRVRLRSLSESGVRALVGPRQVDAAAIYRLTGGNPFFVTEVLAGAPADLPSTVRDAVLGRVARLSPPAQTVIDMAAVLGPHMDMQSLATMLGDEAHGDDAHAVDECVTRGVLVEHADGLAFRHELARQAVLSAIAPRRRRHLHGLALRALSGAPIPAGGADLTLLAHHADQAADRSAILRYAPPAARQAAAGGAHRAAAALYRRVLPCAVELPAAERAALLEACSTECYLIAEVNDAVDFRREAVALWHAAGDPRKEGANLAQLAVALNGADRRDEAREAAEAAVALLQLLPAGRELAGAFRIRALMHTFEHELTEATALAGRAVALADQLGDLATLTMAYDTLGLATMYTDYAAGRHYLLHARTLAQQRGADADVARTFGELGSNAVQLLHLDDAESDLTDGLAYSAERDLDYYRHFMLASRAAVYLLRGRWEDAVALAEEVLHAPMTSTNARLAALVTLGRVRARQGHKTAAAVLDAALELALRLRVFHATGPVRAARAEARWLAGDASGARMEADAAYSLAVERRHVTVAAELAYWRALTGASAAPPDWIAQPYALQLGGDWRSAADAWRTLGCPYEQARALVDGDRVAMFEALALFDDLGAQPAAATLRRGMRSRGIARVPRGPRSATRANRFGLTNRQLEILVLLAEGLSNPEIGTRLSITPKTAEHHVAAVLAKLDVPSRRAATRLARQERLIDPH